MTHEGTIQGYNHGHRQGTIRSFESEDFYFHLDEWLEGDLPRRGQIVSFTTGVHLDNPVAQKVSILKNQTGYYRWVPPEEFIFYKEDEPGRADVFAVIQEPVTVWGPTHPLDTCARTPDELKWEMQTQVERKFGANAILGFEIQSAQRSKGTYGYTEYVLTGFPAIVGRRIPAQSQEIEDHSRQEWMEFSERMNRMQVPDRDTVAEAANWATNSNKNGVMGKMIYYLIAAGALWWGWDTFLS